MNSRHNIAFLLLTALLAVRGFGSIPAPVADALGRVRAFTATASTFPVAGSATPDSLINFTQACDGSRAWLETPDAEFSATRVYTGGPGGWTIETTDQATGNRVIETWNLRRLDWRDELDATGNLVCVTRYGYDGLGRLTDEVRVGGEPALVTTVTRYEYDAAGRVYKVHRPGQANPTVISYVPHSTRPASVNCGGEGTLAFLYDAQARVTQRRYTPATSASTAPLGVDAYQLAGGVVLVEVVCR